MNTSTNDHPDRLQLTAFLDGRLTEAERIVIERHVETCDDCCAAMSEMPQDTLSGRLLDVDTDVDDPSIAAESLPLATEDTSGIPEALIDHPRYRILGPLGKGGMGVVYKAEHRMMDREVALKVIDGRFIENPQAIERFRTEVRAAAKLSHANIVRAYDAEQADNLHFLVMEYVDGVSLAELIRRNGPLPIHQVCGIIRKVAQGLHHAFENGMVHRDIKPQNVMITQDGRVRILDFGLARLARERDSAVPTKEGDLQEQMRRTADTLTLVGSVLGTPDYIAPEQAMDARHADTRSDIYSLGCTCYFLLTGSPPYPIGTAIQKLVAHTESRPAPIAQLRSGVPMEVAAITERMMKRQPSERYQTPREVAQAMDDFMKSGSSTAVTATHADHAVDATLNEQHSAFSDLELHKVDLAAISAGDSALLSFVDGTAASTLNTQAETQASHAFKRPLKAEANSSQQKRQVPGQPSPRRNRGVRFLWVVLTTALLGTVVFAVILAMKTVEPEPEPRPTLATTPTSEWIDLLQAVRPNTDAQRGRWHLDNGELVSSPLSWARIALPVDVPEQYEFAVEFTRESGSDSVALIFAMNDHQATLDLDAWYKHLAGIQYVGGVNCENNGLGVPDIRLVIGERHTASVRVLSNRVEAYLDGKPLKHYEGDGSNLSLHEKWKLRNLNGIGLGSFDSVFRFHQVRLRPLTDTSR